MKNEDIGTIVKAIIWWFFILVWLCFARHHAESATTRRGNERSEDNSEQRNIQRPLTEEEKEARKTFIIKSIIVKRIISKTRDGLDFQKVSTSFSDHEVNHNQSTLDRNAQKQQNLEKCAQIPQDNIIMKSLSKVSLLLDRIAVPMDMENICAICLSNFEVDEEICFSHNSQCSHFYHKDCIVKWLMHRDECPCCRNNYLINDKVGKNLTEDTENTDQNTGSNNDINSDLIESSRNESVESRDLELGVISE